MKRISVLMIVAFAALLAGCRQSSLPTVEGQVVDATIHSVTLETPEGETLTLNTLGSDPMLVPGVLAGDAVRVAYEEDPENGELRAVRLDITAPSAYRLIPGVWRDCTGPVEVGLVLAEDGSAQAVGLPDLTLRDWSLDGEHLALGAADPSDPAASKVLLYKIERLNADSLVISPVEAEGLHLSLSRSE